MTENTLPQEELKEWINKGADEYAFKLPVTSLDSAAKGYAYSGFKAGAAALYAHLKPLLDEKDENINELTMADMTHEYNEAEAEKFRPEYERQLKEPFEEEIKELKKLNEAMSSQFELLTSQVVEKQRLLDAKDEEIERLKK